MAQNNRIIKPEPNMLKTLPIIASSTSYQVFLCYLYVITYYSYLAIYVLLFQALTSRET